MSCLLCASPNQEEFTAEVNIHFRGIRNVDNPGVLIFPRLLVCSDCGFSRFTASRTELALLAGGFQKVGASPQKRVVLRRKIQIGA
jgi:hypothetical protein